MPTDHTKSFEVLIIKEFLKLQKDIDYVIYPDPPDCLITFKDGSKLWIEVSAIYRDEENPVKDRQLAKIANSDPTGILHREDLGVKGKQEEDSIKTILKRISAKDSKPNYKKFRKEYGKGILLLYIDDPLACHKTIDAIKNENNYYGIERLDNFHSVFLYIRKVYIKSEGKRFSREGFTKLYQLKKINRTMPKNYGYLSLKIKNSFHT